MSITGNLTRFRGHTSVQDSVSAPEWQARVELAAAHRYAEHRRWTDLICVLQNIRRSWRTNSHAN